jgi:GT2 family glycosyltransferase
MNVLIIGLIYGNRSSDFILQNIANCGYQNIKVRYVNTEGIANALNDGIDLMKELNMDAVAFLANDIIEPQDWLKKKLEALQTYPDAGVVASSLDCGRNNINSELIISNWLLSKETVEKVGYFQESMFPYGPIDLDYCHRCYAAGLKTYYVMDCLAQHIGDHAAGNEYGWDKGALVEKGYGLMYQGGDYFLNRKDDGKE